MDSAKVVCEHKLSDELVELCELLAEIEKSRRKLEKVLDSIVDKDERLSAQKMVRMMAVDLGSLR